MNKQEREWKGKYIVRARTGMGGERDRQQERRGRLREKEEK